MEDGRHLEKIETSPYISNGLANLDEIWQYDTERVPQAYEPLKCTSVLPDNCHPSALLTDEIIYFTIRIYFSTYFVLSRLLPNIDRNSPAGRAAANE